MQEAISLLIGFFGRRTYYRVRKGERLLFPDEQKVVLNIIRSCGGSDCLEFDAYVEGYEW